MVSRKYLSNSLLLSAFIFLLFCSISILEAQEFDIRKFSDPQKYGWADETLRLDARDDLFIRNMLLEDYNKQAQSPLTNVIKTSFAPGWGHFSLGSYTKGQVLLGTQLGLLGTSLYLREKANIEYKKYKGATQIDAIHDYYESAIIPYRQSNLLLGLFVVVWGYTIYDVVLETHNYNDNIWNELTNSMTVGSLNITPISISYRF